MIRKYLIIAICFISLHSFADEYFFPLQPACFFEPNNLGSLIDSYLGYYSNAALDNTLCSYSNQSWSYNYLYWQSSQGTLCSVKLYGYLAGKALCFVSYGSSTVLCQPSSVAWVKEHWDVAISSNYFLGNYPDSSGIDYRLIPLDVTISNGIIHGIANASCVVRYDDSSNPLFAVIPVKLYFGLSEPPSSPNFNPDDPFPDDDVEPTTLPTLQTDDTFDSLDCSDWINQLEPTGSEARIFHIPMFCPDDMTLSSNPTEMFSQMSTVEFSIGGQTQVMTTNLSNVWEPLNLLRLAFKGICSCLMSWGFIKSIISTIKSY